MTGSGRGRTRIGNGMENDRLEEILVGALDRVGDDRAAFLEIACGVDVALKSRV